MGALGTFQIPEGRAPWVQKVGVIVFFLLLPPAALGALELRPQWARLWVLAAPLVMASAAALITYGNVRFRAPAELSVAVLAGVGLRSLWSRGD